MSLDLDNDSDVDSVTSLPPFSAAPSVGTISSFEPSWRSGSPAPSVWSVTSSVRAQALRQEFGRSINTYSEVYRLPADDEELNRLSASNYCL
jgi:hypothetical protein